MRDLQSTRSLSTVESFNHPLLADRRYQQPLDYRKDISGGVKIQKERVYAVITRIEDGLPQILLKQRGDLRDFQHYYDLPGGELPKEEFMIRGLETRLNCQLNIPRTSINEIQLLGNDLYQIANKQPEDGSVIDCARAYVVTLNQGTSITPNQDENVIGYRWCSLEDLKTLQIINLDL